MDFCKGFNDWLACIKCPDICTKKCPIEGKNAFECLAHKMSLSNKNFDLTNERDGYESFKQS